MLLEMKEILLTVQIPNAASQGVRQHQRATGFYHKSDTLEQIWSVDVQSFHVIYCAIFFSLNTQRAVVNHTLT